MQLGKVGKTLQLLNCDDHKTFLVKHHKNPSDYRPDICHQSLLTILDSPLVRMISILPPSHFTNTRTRTRTRTYLPTYLPFTTYLPTYPPTYLPTGESTSLLLLLPVRFALSSSSSSSPLRRTRRDSCERCTCTPRRVSSSRSIPKPGCHAPSVGSVV